MSTAVKTQTEGQLEQKRFLKAPTHLADEIDVDLGDDEGAVLATTGRTSPEGPERLDLYVSTAEYLRAMREPEVTPEDVAQDASEGAACGDHVLRAGAPGPSAQMARFVLPDGVTLEIHIPGATGVEGGDSAATEAGFILRRGTKLLNVGPLGRVLGL